MIRPALVLLALFAFAGFGRAAETFSIQVDRGHPWRPPFGLERVGAPREIVVESREKPPAGAYEIVEFAADGRELERAGVVFPSQPPYRVRTPLFAAADQAALVRSSPGEGRPVELARRKTTAPPVEAEAVALAEPVVNPVDLGTILPPRGWLVIGPESQASVEIAALARGQSHDGAVIRISYQSARTTAPIEPFSLRAGAIRRARFSLGGRRPKGDRDALDVVIEDPGGRVLWSKRIPVVIVAAPPARPRFGATYERLRYDAPISVREADGQFTSKPYEGAWRAELRDVVVRLPGGGRFVFWRGSSYIPFWAGRHNTGACYEWAEIISQPAGAVDCVEPLMDKELRYSRAEILESTPARVHVRWSYQSTDFNYKVWGDQAVEDYYFYPDGMGVRIVTLTADPANDYELAEFILLTPQGAFPFEVLPKAPVDAIFLDGSRFTHSFPDPAQKSTIPAARPADGRAAIYRLRLNPLDEQAAVSFSPRLKRYPGVVFGPFLDQGLIVTPCYWGSHWPLARGNSTGNAIDDRVALTPCHCSVMSWAGVRPEPLFSLDATVPDAQGRPRPMRIRRWAWLIGMTGAADEELRDWARSYAATPRFEVHGARPCHNQDAHDRRAIPIEGGGREVELILEPRTVWLNPVVEWANAPAGTPRLELDGRALEPARWAWDGRVLWIQARVDRKTRLRVHFDQAG